MPITRCPACTAPTSRTLNAPSQHATVNYYRCEHCSHVWTTSKATGELVQHITPLTKKPKERAGTRDAP